MLEDNTASANQTYEEATALASISKTSDPIHYNPSYAYRNSPYRHLHHQNGTIGTFHVRILEAKNLKRNSWNLLGLGPVKHLGLSRAHGEVSSYAVLRLGFRSRLGENDNIPFDIPGTVDNMNNDVGTGGRGSASEVKPPASSSHYSVDSSSSHSQHTSSIFGNESIASAISASVAAPIPPAHAGILASESSSSMDAMEQSKVQANPQKIPSHGMRAQTQSFAGNTYYSKTYQSTIIPFNSNPKWPTVQTESNRSSFDMELYKNMPYDGMEISLQVQMREEKSAADNAMGIIPVQGIVQGGDDLIGEAELNLTELVLRDFGCLGGGSGTGGRDGESGPVNFIEEKEQVVDVWDQWIDLSKAKGASAVGAGTKNDTDRNRKGSRSQNEERRPQLRILVSYEPNGFHPRRGDVVALESFARRPISACKSRPILSPLHPLRVKDIRGEFLLCTFDMDIHTNNSAGSSSSSTNRKKKRIGSIRLHRNTIFVIERTNLVDSAINVALKPADVVLSTPIGKEVSDVAQPYVESAGDLLMPAVLSAKLMFEAAKVGGGAFVVGLKSAAVAVAESQDPEKKRRARRRRTLSE